jgi:transposase
MKLFIEGEDRRQAILLPDCLEDYVSDENPVRVIEAFIDEIDLKALGFDGVVPEVTGRPSYHPATLLKIYLYGYLNRIPSSRRLERETQCNIELMWLTGRLMPDFKTIADFRRDNGPAIRAVCTQFVPQLRTYRRHPDEFLPLIDAVGHLLDKPLANQRPDDGAHYFVAFALQSCFRHRSRRTARRKVVGRPRSFDEEKVLEAAAACF